MLTVFEIERTTKSPFGSYVKKDKVIFAKELEIRLVNVKSFLEEKCPNLTIKNLSDVNEAIKEYFKVELTNNEKKVMDLMNTLGCM